MIRQKKRWEDEELIMIGREEARADFIHGTTVSSTLSLNGDWKFLFLEAPEYSPDTFLNKFLMTAPGILQKCRLVGSKKAMGIIIIQMYGIYSLLTLHLFRQKILPEYIEGILTLI